MVKKLRLIARAEAGLNIKPVYSPDKPCKVLVTVYAPTRRRLDPPNLYPTVKALIDGLTDANLWPDDNHEVIKMMSFQYGGLSGESGKFKIVLDIEGARMNSKYKDKLVGVYAPGNYGHTSVLDQTQAFSRWFWANRKDMELISAKLGINAKKLNRILMLEQLPDEELLKEMMKLCDTK